MNEVLRISPRLPVADLAAAVAFYGDLLGFETGSLWPAEAPTFVLLVRGAVALQFFLPDDRTRLPALTAAPNDRPMIALDVGDARSLHRHFENRAIAIEWGPEVFWYGRREFAVRDPNGYLVIFSEETNDPPTCNDR